MNGLRGLRALLMVPPLVAAFSLAPAASAQSSSAQQTCSLLTVEEVASVLDSPDETLVLGGGVLFCNFTGTRSLTIGVRPGTSLDEYRVDSTAPGGGSAVTVDGYPAWWWPDAQWLAAEVDGRVLVLGSSGAQSPETLLVRLTSLATLVIPRLPLPPDQDATARLRGFVPTTLGDETITVESLTGDLFVSAVEFFHPEAASAFESALASVGKTPADLLIAIGRLDSGQAAFVALQVPGVDASTVVLSLAEGLFPGAADAGMTELGGKPVHMFVSDPPVFGYASGDTAFYATAVGAPLDDFFAPLP